ncbi:archaetidylserine decarboxylase [Nibricoccus sp. IMCC34717]|uniref:archaetidylserine decarboxylase n=1 Tax=Nibricoccus sp. IMCC34717 TaxID=3034021 RepID=UPI0038503105
MSARPTPIEFFNRYTGQVETEQVYGEKWLRFAYENGVGGFFLNALVKRRFFSWLYGFQMNKRVSASKILPFVLDYNLDTEEFAKSVYDYTTFNEFFSRKLKPEARPIATGDDVVVFPADGRHLGFQSVDDADGFYVKGAKFSLVELFGEAQLPEDKRVLSRRFAGGSLVISRLCPVDYHRFHFPVSGTPTEAKLLNGFLYSVSPIALRLNVNYLVQNKRLLTVIDGTPVGSVAMFEVGATNVGSIVETFLAGRPCAKGEEKGLFKFGGSCVITVFEKGKVQLEPDLVRESGCQRETFVRMGDRMARRLSST